jgi:hypothetical protein
VELPEQRWRISVGIGDPNGSWLRASLIAQEGNVTGAAERIEGLLVEPLGEVSARFDPAGLVVIDLPPDGLGPLAADVAWVEGTLGPEGAPVAQVGSLWFTAAVLFGEAAPGELPGGRYGALVPAPPEVTAPPVVADTGDPAVVDLAGGVASVRWAGPPPTEVGGVAVAAATDLITVVPVAEGVNDAPQVRVDLATGEVTAGLGPVLGPAGGDGAVVPPAVDPSGFLLDQPGPGGITAPGATLSVDVLGLAGALGQPTPSDGVGAVAVTRVLDLADGTTVVAPGVVGDQVWFGAGAIPEPTTMAAGAAAGTAAPMPTADGDDGPPLWLLVAAAGAGLLAVGVAVTIAAARRRRRDHKGVPASARPDNVPAATGPAATGPAATGPATTGAVPAGTPPPVQHPPVPAPPGVPDAPPVASGSDTPPGTFGWSYGSATSQPDSGDTTADAPGDPGDPGDAADTRDTGSARPDTRPTPGPRSGDEGGLSALDDDLDDLTRRLRNLGDGGS